MKLLLVEDDRMIGEAVRQGLREEGFTLDWVQDGRAAEVALDGGQYALVILDLGLPRRDGLAVLKGLRAAKQPIPVLILTARDSVRDRVTGLDAGADDYLIKPFDLDELAARVRALLRRQAGRSQPIIQWGALAVKPDTREVTLHGRSVALSGREYALLAALLERPGAALSRAQLEERLYGWGEEVESNAVEVHIHNLRRKLGPELIRNVRGVGYLVPRIG
ncbi:MAG TPA: response regulator [Burkholderiales bacterium]|jgi:two-component system response regulator QseB